MGRKQASTPASALPIDPSFEDEENNDDNNDEIHEEDDKKPEVVYQYPLTKFRFTKLPADVQQRIWSFFPRTPHHVEVRFDMNNWWSSRCPPRKKIPLFTAISPTPKILHICHASRVEGMKYLKLVFKKDYMNNANEEPEYEEPEQFTKYRVSRSGPIDEKDPRIAALKPEPPKNRSYINPEIDTLHVFFPAWCWPYMQGVHESMIDMDDDDNGKSMEDFASTWNKRRVEIAMVWWERAPRDFIRHNHHSMMVIRQEYRGRSKVPAKPGVPGKPGIKGKSGINTVIKKFCKDRENLGCGLLNPKIDETFVLGRWDKGWKRMIQHLMHQDGSHFWI